MNKTTLCLVRHGQTDWNKQFLIQGKTDNPLNETGIEQAHAAGVSLANHHTLSKWDVIVASPLIRAHKTAQIIASYLDYDADIVLMEDFVERDFGIADGQLVDDYYQDVLANKIDKMELHEALISRVKLGLDKLIATYANQNILIVCHSHIIKAAIIYVSEGAYDFTVKLENTSLNIIEHDESVYRLIAHNMTSHL